MGDERADRGREPTPTEQLRIIGRLMDGESTEVLSKETGLPIDRLERWREGWQEILEYDIAMSGEHLFIADEFAERGPDGFVRGEHPDCRSAYEIVGLPTILFYVGEFSIKWAQLPPQTYWQLTPIVSQLLTCQSCGLYSVLYGVPYSKQARIRREWVPNLHPWAPILPSPWEGVPNEVRQDYGEAFEHIAKPRGDDNCLVACRRALEKATIALAGSNAASIDRLTLHQRIERLCQLQQLPVRFAPLLHAIRVLGNKGAHAGVHSQPGRPAARALHHLEAAICHLWIVPRLRHERNEPEWVALFDWLDRNRPGLLL